MTYLLFSMTQLEKLPTFVKGFHSSEINKMVYKIFGNTKMYTSVLGLGKYNNL